MPPIDDKDFETLKSDLMELAGTFDLFIKWAREKVPQWTLDEYKAQFHSFMDEIGKTVKEKDMVGAHRLINDFLRTSCTDKKLNLFVFLSRDLQERALLVINPQPDSEIAPFLEKQSFFSKFGIALHLLRLDIIRSPATERMKKLRELRDVRLTFRHTHFYSASYGVQRFFWELPLLPDIQQKNANSWRRDIQRDLLQILGGCSPDSADSVLSLHDELAEVRTDLNVIQETDENKDWLKATRLVIANVETRLSQGLKKVLTCTPVVTYDLLTPAFQGELALVIASEKIKVRQERVKCGLELEHEKLHNFILDAGLLRTTPVIEVGRMVDSMVDMLRVNADFLIESFGRKNVAGQLLELALEVCQAATVAFDVETKTNLTPEEKLGNIDAVLMHAASVLRQVSGAEVSLITQDKLEHEIHQAISVLSPVRAVFELIRWLENHAKKLGKKSTKFAAIQKLAGDLRDAAQTLHINSDVTHFRAQASSASSSSDASKEAGLPGFLQKAQSLIAAGMKTNDLVQHRGILGTLWVLLITKLFHSSVTLFVSSTHKHLRDVTEKLNTVLPQPPKATATESS